MIIYALVARGPTVLAEFTESHGNVAAVAHRILEHIPTGESRMSYIYDRHMFHYIVEKGLVYLCMTDENFPRRVAFTFLEDIKERFWGTYAGRVATAPPMAFNPEFSRVLKDKMEFYSRDTTQDRLEQVRGELAEVKSVMVQNIERVLERSDRIEILVDKTDNLNQQAFQFKKKSAALKRKMWWKNQKMVLLGAVAAALMLYFLTSMACGGLTLPCMR